MVKKDDYYYTNCVVDMEVVNHKVHLMFYEIALYVNLNELKELHKDLSGIIEELEEKIKHDKQDIE